MNKIESFTINHQLLKPGLYVSRYDSVGLNYVTTFDLRFTRPNIEPPMETSGIHTIEHLGATFLRNDEKWKDKIIYFGPMGCRTGFYLLIAGKLSPNDIQILIIKMCEFIINYDGIIPGASSIECGNYLDMNLNLAKYYTKLYLKQVEGLSKENSEYPS